MPVRSHYLEQLGRSRLMWIFTAPSDARDASAALASALSSALAAVDIVQVRVKRAGQRSGPSDARGLLHWTDCVLARVDELEPALRPLVLVNDRVDVAQLRASSDPAKPGVAGVHLGRSDTPPAEARRLLGDDALIGLSTNIARQVVESHREPVDYLGFGPIFASATKGYGRDLAKGSESAWSAATAAPCPLFPIGGIDTLNAEQLASVGRAAVGSAILDAPDPALAARVIRAALAGQ